MSGRVCAGVASAKDLGVEKREGLIYYEKIYACQEVELRR